MTIDRATRTGGWAALGAAVLILLKIPVTLLALGNATGEPAYGPAVAVEIAEFVALGIAFWSLHRWFVGINARLARVALWVGLAGLAIAMVGDIFALGGAPLSDEVFLVVFLAAQLGVATWLFLAGTLISRSTTILQPSGWLGQVGAFGYVLVGAQYIVATFARDASKLGGIAAFAPLLVLFGVAFFVRLGRFAATGKLARGPI